MYKDLLKHDPSSDVRNNILLHVNLDTSTIERVCDECVTVRQNFFRVILPHLKLRELSIEKRALILEKSVLEREFDAYSFF